MGDFVAYDTPRAWRAVLKRFVAYLSGVTNSNELFLSGLYGR